MLLIGVLELFVEATAVQIALKLGDVSLLAVVAAHLVEDFDEDGQQRIDLRLADDIGFLIDVEEDALRRDGHRPLQIAAQDLIVAAFGQEQVERGGSIDMPVFQQERQHLQQVRFTRAEEAGNPDAIGACIVVIGGQKVFQPLFHLIGDDL